MAFIEFSESSQSPKLVWLPDVVPVITSGSNSERISITTSGFMSIATHYFEQIPSQR